MQTKSTLEEDSYTCHLELSISPAFPELLFLQSLDWEI